MTISLGKADTVFSACCLESPQRYLYSKYINHKTNNGPRRSVEPLVCIHLHDKEFQILSLIKPWRKEDSVVSGFVIVNL